MKLKAIAGLAFAAAFSVSAAAHAQLITSSASIVGPTSVINFSDIPDGRIWELADPNVSLQVGNSVGRDLRMSYQIGDMGLYQVHNDDWGLDPSGNWNRYAIGINQSGTARFMFADGPVSAIGGIMNYAGCCISSSIFIRSLNASGGVIDEFNLLNDAPIPAQGANMGLFRGFQYNSAIVYGFEFGDSGESNPSVVLADLTFANSGVTVTPEPASMILMGAGLLVVGVATRKRRSQA